MLPITTFVKLFFKFLGDIIKSGINCAFQFADEPDIQFCNNARIGLRGSAHRGDITLVPVSEKASTTTQVW